MKNTMLVRVTIVSPKVEKTNYFQIGRVILNI